MMLGFEGSNRFALALALPMHRKAGVTAKRGNWSKRGMLPILGGVSMWPVLRFFFAHPA